MSCGTDRLYFNEALKTRCQLYSWLLKVVVESILRVVLRALRGVKRFGKNMKVN